LIGMASVGAVAIAIGGTFAWSRLTPAPQEPPEPAFPVHHTDAEWRAILTPAAYNILRQAGTETPFSSPLLTEHRQGIFSCAGCNTKLFDSRTKYDSHTGWPSFWDKLPNALITREDRSLGMVRTEVRCVTCGSHVGHLFDDGPKPTGLRYCMNGAGMTFSPMAA
jgi:peptide-methionine (R)-S-oxide reductase